MSVAPHLGLVTPGDGLLDATTLAEPEGRRPALRKPLGTGRNCGDLPIGERARSLPRLLQPSGWTGR